MACRCCWRSNLIFVLPERGARPYALRNLAGGAWLLAALVEFIFASGTGERSGPGNARALLPFFFRCDRCLAPLPGGDGGVYRI